MNDCISRQSAIEVIDAVFPVDPMKSEYAQGIACGAALAKTYVEQLPASQPEIIRCKDCKYRDENWRRVSVKWLPCMDVRTGSNWYCGSAERGEQE